MIKKILFVLLIVFTVISFKTVNHDTLVLSVPYSFEYEFRHAWLSLEARINSAPQNKVILNWRGLGGRVDIGDQFISFLHKTSKTVILRLTGETWSTHSLVFCNTPNTEFKQGYLVFHAVSNDNNGRLLTDNSTKQGLREHMQGCVRKGIITDKDITKVNQLYVLHVYPNGRKNFTRDMRRK